MIRLSASSVPRALACPGHMRLPHHDYRTKYAEAGEAHHAEAEAAADLGDHDGLPEKVAVLIREGDELIAECGFAYDVATDTARQLGHVRRRYADLAPYEIPGTPDLIIKGNGRIVVVDYKEHERVAPAATNAQTATYALMVARAFGVNEVTVVICYRTDGWCDFATLGPIDLQAHADQLHRLAIDVARADAPLAIGPHCKYCPAFMSCPKQHALMGEVKTDLPVRIEAAMPFTDDDEASDALDLFERLRMLTARLQAALIARAHERPIPRPDGRMFGPVEKQGNEKLDGDVVWRVVTEKFGRDKADEVVTRTATKKKLKDVLGAKGEKEIVEAVRARGGSKRETKTVIEVYEPQKLLKVV